MTAGIDTTRPYETPEGVVLELRLAGPVARAGAWTVDLGIRALIYLALGYVMSLFGGVGWSVALIGGFLIEWLYPVVFEVRAGATPGKRALGLEVVHDNGTPVSFRASMIRNLLRVADILPFLYGFGLASMLIDRDFRRLGDLAAGTLVVYAQSAGRALSVPEVEPVPLPAVLDLDEQLKLLLFAERSATLSRQRRAELAGILSGLTGRQGDEAVDRLHGYARWIVQGR